MNAAARLVEIQARVDNATDGPWSYHWLTQEVHGMSATLHSHAGPADTVWTTSLLPEIGSTREAKDAEFIAHARTDVPALVAALQAVLAQCDRHESIGASTDYEVGRKYVADCVRRAVENALGVAS